MKFQNINYHRFIKGWIGVKGLGTRLGQGNVTSIFTFLIFLLYHIDEEHIESFASLELQLISKLQKWTLLCIYKDFGNIVNNLIFF